MTEAEALSELRSFPISCLDFKEQMALDMAIEAMKKQIAKKLIGGYKCASCGNDVTETCYHIDFCPFCGQKLNWSEV